MRTPSLPVTVREALLSDAPAVAKLFDLYRQFYEQPADLPLASEFVQQRIQQQESVILIAEGGGTGLLGFCQLYPTFCSVEAQPIYVLYDLFVHPDARQGGVGRRLLEAAEARAVADGKVRMDLSTAKTNTSAQKLYASQGWVRDEVFFVYSRSIGNS